MKSLSVVTEIIDARSDYIIIQIIDAPSYFAQITDTI